MALPTAGVAMSGVAYADVYPTQTAFLETGIILGWTVRLADGTVIRALAPGGSIALNAACKVSTATAGTTDTTVIATTAVGNICVAVNDRSVLALTTANCYATYFTTGGVCKPLVASGVTNGAIVAPSSSAGTLYGATVGTDGQWNIEALANVVSGPAATACVITGQC